MTILLEIPEALECLININIDITMTFKRPYLGLTTPVAVPLWTWILLFAVMTFDIVNHMQERNYFTPAPSNLESQVRTWASDYPNSLRDRWAWCYLDSAENWSTDQKLREDVRLKSVQVLTDTERQTLLPLDDKIADAVPQQKTPLKDTYEAVGNGLRVNEWTPGSRSSLRSEEESTPPEPIRRRISRR